MRASCSSDVAIRAVGLGKSFRSSASLRALLRGQLFGTELRALQDIELHVCRGEIIGLMGPNGAGKSTLLRLVAGLLIPDTGSLQVLGQDVARVGAAFRRQVCFINCDERSFSWRLSGAQNLQFFAALHGLHGSHARERVERAVHLTGLDEHAARPVREYSSGLRQRLALARGLLGDPAVFLFDEPTRGLDPLTAARLRRLIREELVTEQHTAIVATHSFSDVRDLCDRVVVLEQGRIAAQGPPEQAAAMIGLSAGDGAAE